MSNLKAAIASLDNPTRALLAQHYFDEDTLVQVAQVLTSDTQDVNTNLIGGDLQPPAPHNLHTLPDTDSPESVELRQLGEDATAAGEVMILVLNGGMATRFGGVVKGVVSVTDNLSFLGWKLKSSAAACSNYFPRILLLNSFSTHESTLRHLRDNDFFGYAAENVETAVQNISLRLTPDGGLFKTSNGEASPFAPGHGDVLDAVKRSEAFQNFRNSGGKYVFMCNVDNILATLDPIVLGAHIRGGKAMTVEAAPRVAGDKGGAPISVDGRVEIVEGFRIPPDFDIESLEVFNTNTFWMNVECWDTEAELTWFRANKVVDGEKAVQFERLIGELTHFIDACYLRVARDGHQSRFFPVKTPDELEPARLELEGRLKKI